MRSRGVLGRFMTLCLCGGIAMLLASCDGEDGAPGAPGAPGTVGTDGEDGNDGGAVFIYDNHGTDMLLSTGEYETADKELVTVTITSATASASAITVSYTVEDADGDPVAGITGETSFSACYLAPADVATTGESFNKWVSYVYHTETVSGAGYPNVDGTEADQAYREEETEGTFTDHGDGSYSYTFAANPSSVTETPVDALPVTYDASLTHRVSVMIGGHAGPTGDANYDFVPNGNSVTETRDIVQTSTCVKCHSVEFAGHGGDRLTMENCVTCHQPGSYDAQSGESMDMTVMIHKIHAGGELPSVAGLNGITLDDPYTGTDESADNGEYVWYGHNDRKMSWEHVGFPAVLANCTACHEGSGADVDNWKNVPSRDACGSCHDDIDFTDVADHTPVQANDSGCTVCHTPAVIADDHDWTVKDLRHIMEFDVDITVSGATGGTGTYFKAGDAPLVTIVVNDAVTGTPIDHTTFIKDEDGGEGGDPDTATAGDGAYTSARFMVQGPRARFKQVLHYGARAEVLATAGPTFDLSTDADLKLVVDGGKDLLTGGPGHYEEPDGTLLMDDGLLPANITVDVDPAAFTDDAAATPAEIMAWLNADADFAGRCIAYIDEKATGLLAIRSRDLGDVCSIQLVASDVATTVFADDLAKKTPGSRSDLYQTLSDPTKNDPLITYSAANISYQLDPVDDLQAGTYVISVEIADRGRGAGGEVDYTTPSVASTTFQVGTADVEPPVAYNCGSCHWSSTTDTGFVLDYRRHNKPFTNDAVDKCVGCHDYQPGSGREISARVHAVHNGSELNYPIYTVAHEDAVPGRNWNIVYPMDIRNCESCHTDADTSGSWLAEAARLPCGGCHDSDAARAHMKLQTYDPTPTDSQSGDEEESCKICH